MSPALEVSVYGVPQPAGAKQLRALEEQYRGVPGGWTLLTCPGCGADFATKSGPLLFDPCGNCGSYMGVVTSMRTTTRA